MAGKRQKQRTAKVLVKLRVMLAELVNTLTNRTVFINVEATGRQNATVY
jgi:hypothetical protein